ncbi:MAG: N-acetyl sugar amidotransferase [Archangiaceae bacterium]|nr:N-acetyl sugar amidotransferase [Archangiaceae bacterium]
MSASYRICVHCIMDTSDPAIVFDDSGECHYCKSYQRVVIAPRKDPATLKLELEQRVEQIKRDGKGRDFDCVAGVSGGVDSTYVLLLAKRYGLRPLAVHLDNGWDSEIAVGNIHRALEKLGVELVTTVLDWEEFRDLQVSFLKASTPDAEIPSDHAIAATVFQTAWKHDIRHLAMGHNFATELIMPKAWSQGHYDWRYISSIQKQFGTRPLRDFPHLALPEYVRCRFYQAKRTLNVLDYVDFSRAHAIEELQRELGWRDYGGKHHESVYTRFYQAHILPTKFGYDKRRAHLSNMILAGRITRAAALEEISRSPYSSKELEAEDRTYVIKKLGLTEGEFDAIMKAPPKRYEDYPNMQSTPWYRAARRAVRTARRVAGRA